MNLEIHSLRITKKFSNQEIQKIETFIEEIYPYIEKKIIVEEEAANQHHHILIFSNLKITTQRNKIKKYSTTSAFYCLKQQNQGDQELAKAYRYLYKGKSRSEKPIVIATFHNQQEIDDYHEEYWNIHALLVEQENISSVEKSWLYIKHTYTKEQLRTVTGREIAVNLQYNRITKNQPPLPQHTLNAYILYIRTKKDEYLELNSIQITLDRYYTLTTVTSMSPEEDDE